MHRITKFAAALAVLPVLGIGVAAGTANAATVDPNGSVFVSKGEVQGALHQMTNKQFDQAVADRSLTFSGVGEFRNLTTITYTVGDQSWSYTTAIDFKAADTRVPVYNAGNGKQVIGFKVTGTNEAGAFDRVEHPVAGSELPSVVVGAAWNAAFAAGTTPKVVVTSSSDYAPGVDGLTVNNEPLTITPAS